MHKHIITIWLTQFVLFHPRKYQKHKKKPSRTHVKVMLNRGVFAEPHLSTSGPHSIRPTQLPYKYLLPFLQVSEKTQSWSVPFEITKMKVFVVLLVAVVALAIAKPQSKYTTKYDNVDLDEIIKSDRLMHNYVKCLLDKGNCSPDGAELKSKYVLAV